MPNETNPVPTESTCERCGDSKRVLIGTHPKNHRAFPQCGCEGKPCPDCCPIPQPEVGEWEKMFLKKFCIMDVGTPDEELELDQPYTHEKEKRLRAGKFLDFFRAELSRRESERRERTERAVWQIKDAYEDAIQTGGLSLEQVKSIIAEAREAADKAKKNLNV